MPSKWGETKYADIDLLQSFRGRHPDLTLRRPPSMSIATATTTHPYNVRRFFDNLITVIQQTPYKAHQIFNMDETGFSRVPIQHSVSNLRSFFNNIFFMVVDSWGKVPSGVFSGNLLEQGDFGQCFRISVAEKIRPQCYLGMQRAQAELKTVRVKQSRCRFGEAPVCLDLDTEPRAREEEISQMFKCKFSFRNYGTIHSMEFSLNTHTPNNNKEIGLTTGVCVSNTCAPDVINKIHTKLNRINANIMPMEMNCTL